MKSSHRSQSWPNQKWRWIIPILLLLLFLSTLIWLPWQAQRMEANERQEQLIADSLWVEQAIQFQLTRNDEVLRQIGSDIKAAKLQKEAVLERFNTILKNNREIQRIAWYDVSNKVLVDTRESLQASAERLPLPHFEFGSLDISEETACLKPVLEINARNAYLMHCQIPLVRDERRIGSMMISYRMNALLEELVPWWFAQDNQITITDIDDRILAERSAGGSGKNVYTHSRALELPSLTLVLRTNSIKTEPKLLSNLLVLSVILLSIGLIWSLLALWRDINRRLAAEGALRQQVTFRTAMENSLVTGLRARDMTGRLTYVNPAFCRMVGFPAEEIIGRIPPMPYWAPEAIEEYQQRFTQLLAGTVPSEGFETIYQHASGERIPVLIYESALIDEHGKQTGWMSSILDISELRRAQELSRQQEEKLHTSAKLATMGEIASMLAHELNQPLAAISSYTTGAVNLLQAGVMDRSLFQSALEKVNAQAQRAGQIIRSVHEFVKKREAAREPLQIADLIQSAMPLVELQAQASHVALQWKIKPQLPLVLADRVLLEQVLLNLTRNGIEAMQTTAPEKRILRVEAVLDEASQQIIVSVTDRGHGIPAEVAEKLFSPFFTTKSAGMGMGLNICRTAIEFHGGRLSHHENPAGGTIFQFALPIQD
ncbi:sensor histidine kinase [Undibacterium umbellatum]|uniref:histidine kinase n=1 Tax=Undibacterium umbellatum TaxID=2762300 RepID=A0ABR6Z5X1_9BURK|nr:ATP-binding protein [Undibacterium umbellatum]MBC3907174.1 PAS domain S-box protein [Undibacterium umbellatum]